MATMSAEPSASTLVTPPSSLPTLPFEIIDLISTFLDRPGAIPFGLASHSFRQLVIPFIWREINLNIPEHYGKLPDVRSAEDLPRMRNRHQKVEDRRVSALREMVKEVLYWGDRRKWAKVQVLRIAAGDSSIQEMVVILGLVSSNLQKLVIEADTSLFAGRMIPDRYSVELRLLTSTITLPFLTSLRLSSGAIRFPQFISHIFIMAPGLTSLDLDIDEIPAVPWAADFIPPPRSIVHNTKLEQLRLCLTMDLYTDEDDEDEEDVSLSLPFLKLFQRSPQIRKLSFEYTSEMPWMEQVYFDVLGVVVRYDFLEDLCWMSGNEALMWYADPRESGAHGGFPALRRLVIQMEQWTDVFEHIPTIENLQKLYFIPSCHMDLSALAFLDTPHTAHAQPMTPTFARSIYSASELRIIHILHDEIKIYDLHVFERLDAIDAVGQYTGYVRSFWNGKEKDGREREDDLLHVRLLLNRYEVTDSSHTGKVPSVSHRPENTIYYSDHHGGRRTRVKTFEKRPEATWQHFTHYRGKIVSLGIFEQMRVVEGVSEGEWDMRGIKVGDEAWKILTDWHESLPK